MALLSCVPLSAQFSQYFLVPWSSPFQSSVLYWKGRKRKKQKTFATSPWDHSYSNLKGRFPSLRVLVCMGPSYHCCCCQKTLFLLLKPELEGFSWNSLHSYQCSPSGFCTTLSPNQGIVEEREKSKFTAGSVVFCILSQFAYYYLLIGYLFCALWPGSMATSARRDRVRKHLLYLTWKQNSPYSLFFFYFQTNCIRPTLPSYQNQTKTQWRKKTISQ